MDFKMSVNWGCPRSDTEKVFVFFGPISFNRLIVFLGDIPSAPIFWFSSDSSVFLFDCSDGPSDLAGRISAKTDWILSVFTARRRLLMGGAGQLPLLITGVFLAATAAAYEPVSGVLAVFPVPATSNRPKGWVVVTISWQIFRANFKVRKILKVWILRGKNPTF
jgi:hypothetical protein